jgi:hypothetical protein
MKKTRSKKSRDTIPLSRPELTYPGLLVFYCSTVPPLYTFLSVSSARTKGGKGVGVGSSVNNSAITAVFGCRDA